MKSSIFKTKWLVLSAVLAILSAEVGTSTAFAAPQGTLATSVLPALRVKLEQCLIRPYGHTVQGNEVIGDYRSLCSEVVREGRSAFFAIQANASASAWEVQLLGSPYSDGGDISDVALWNDRNQLVLEAQRVISFGDPLEALVRLSGAKPAQKIYDSSLDQVQ